MIIKSKEEIKTKLDNYFLSLDSILELEFNKNVIVTIVNHNQLEFYEAYKNAESEPIELNKSIFKYFDWMIYSDECFLDLANEENYQKIIFEILCDVLRVSNLREFE
jgi:hypothetical protein